MTNISHIRAGYKICFLAYIMMYCRHTETCSNYSEETLASYYDIQKQGCLISDIDFFSMICSRNVKAHVHRNVEDP